ncbi:outer membrane beta-barrel protein [Mariniphaga sp.]|uniref:outer membrane beta-barrel protein n=1 Tax=Mariniphaga sp. TaxID=1954475 RepID=UPI0035638BF3
MKNKNLKIKLVLFFSVLIVSFETLHAQTEFGLKGGALYSGFRDNYKGMTFDFERKSGFLLGVYYKKHNLLGPVGLQTEFLYQLKGVNTYILYHDSENSGGYSEFGYFDKSSAPWLRDTENYHYLSVPVLFSVSPLKFLDIYAGPDLGYLLSFSENRRVTGDLNRFSAGLATGLALKLSENTKLDFRFSSDFTTLYDMGSTNLKNQSFSFSVQQALFRKE